MEIDQSRIENLLLRRLSGARDGGALDAVVSAMLIHLHPHTAKKIGAASLYDGLLLKALVSKDAELIVCVAEELARGRKLAFNAHLSQRFFDRADQLLPMMGAYAFARLLAPIDVRKAIRLFSNAEKAGHIPSAICKHRLIAKSIPVVGMLLGFFWGIRDFAVTFMAIHRSNHIELRFWRYRDVFPDPLEPIDKIMKSDRTYIFDDRLLYL